MHLVGVVLECRQPWIELVAMIRSAWLAFVMLDYACPTCEALQETRAMPPRYPWHSKYIFRCQACATMLRLDDSTKVDRALPWLCLFGVSASASEFVAGGQMTGVVVALVSLGLVGTTYYLTAALAHPT